MVIISFLKNKWKESIYLLFGIIFTKSLEDLNNTLISQGLEDKVFELLSYDDYKPVVYFLFSIIFFFIGTVLIVHNYRYIRSSSIGFGDVMFSFICIILIAIFMYNLFVCISNPILKAIITLIIVGASLTAND